MITFTMRKLLKKITSNLTAGVRRSTIIVASFALVFGIVCSMNTSGGNFLMLSSVSSPTMAQEMNMTDSTETMPMDHCVDSAECGSSYMQHTLLGNLAIGSLLFGSILSLLVFGLFGLKDHFRFKSFGALSFLIRLKFAFTTSITSGLKQLSFKIFDPFQYALSRGLVHPQLYN